MKSCSTIILKEKMKMQEITNEVKLAIRENLLPLLEIHSPIRNDKLKVLLLDKLGLTRDQFGFTESGGSKIENLIGNEFQRLKKFGQAEQEGWIWKTKANSLPLFSAIVEEEEAPQTVQMVAIQEEDEAEIVINDEFVNPAATNRLLSCEGYRNSLIESTPCYGTFDKKECSGCLLAFWCSPFSSQRKEEKKQERIAKKQAKSAKESLFEKYAYKGESLKTLLENVGEAKFVDNQTKEVTLCMFDSKTEIQPEESCVFVKNIGIISKALYNEIKDAGLIQS